MRFSLFLLYIFIASALSAQVSDLNKGNGILLNFTYGAQVPGGDLAKRFGASMSIGSGLEFLSAERNFILGFDGYYLFGANVKQDVLSGLRTPEGYIIGNDKSYADIQLRERGFYLGGIIGKLFSVSPNNPRSAIRITVGAGLLQHKIRIQDDPVRSVPELLGDYKKGYDRLTNGLTINQFIGYQLLSTNKRANFYAGFEFTQAFTQSRRDFNFDTRTVDTAKRLDLLFGIKVGWVLPFYFGKGANEIYY